MSFDIKDYVTVNERILAFYEKYPEGILRADIVTHTDSLVVVKAYAYRGADYELPCTGHSQMSIPGPTSFTRGSEIETPNISVGTRTRSDGLRRRSAASPRRRRSLTSSRPQVSRYRPRVGTPRDSMPSSAS